MSECSYLKLYAARSRSEMEQSGIELALERIKDVRDDQRLIFEICGGCRREPGERSVFSVPF